MEKRVDIYVVLQNAPGNYWSTRKLSQKCPTFALVIIIFSMYWNRYVKQIRRDAYHILCHHPRACFGCHGVKKPLFFRTLLFISDL